MFGKSVSKGRKLTDDQERTILGENLNFSASEAYKLLRTNIMLSLADTDSCRVIGVTSSLPGEAKSTTSINLAYMLAESGKRTVLVEGDLRLPRTAIRLNLKAKPGLSNLLTGMSGGNQVLQHSELNPRLYVITAGDVPPNPSELIGSERMKRTIESLKKNFDYVVLDMPPVNSVADALVASELVHGMIVVVRRGYCRRSILDEALRQLKFSNVKILGLVMTHAETQKKGYYKYKKYGSYGYGYGYGYEQGRPDRSNNGEISFSDAESAEGTR